MATLQPALRPFSGECPPTPPPHASELVHLSLRRNPNTLRPRAPQIWRREGQRERRQKHGPEPARLPPQGPGGRPCHGSLSRPQGHQGQHWALWLLRSRTAPGMRGEGHGRQDRTGGANTDGKRQLQRCIPEAAQGPAPASHPGVCGRGPEVRAQGELWAEAGEGPGANPEAMRCGRKGFCLFQGGSQGSLPFLDNLSPPTGP